MIRRSARKRNYTNIDNAVFSSGLSFRAMGVLCYLLSKPDHWEVSVTHLVNVTAGSKRPDGRDSVYAILGELREAGFIVRTVSRGEGGKMGGYDYEVMDTPTKPFTDLPETAAPYTAAPFPAEPTQVNTENKPITDLLATTDYPKVAKPPTEKAFAIFWEAGMVKTGKKKAQALFADIVKRGKLNPTEFACKLRDDVQARLRVRQYGFDKLHPTTYLSQERWNDEMPANRSLIGPGRNHDLAVDMQAENARGFDLLFGNGGYTPPDDGMTIDEGHA